MNQAVKLFCLAASAVLLASCGNRSIPSAVSRPAAMRAEQAKHVVPFGIAPNHVLTWASIKHTDNVSPTQAAPYLTWADVNVADANAFSAAGIKTVYYTDPNRASSRERMWSNDETTFAHDCNGNRITIIGRPGKYQMDPKSAHLLRLWRGWVHWATKLGHYDAIFDDSADSVRNNSTLPCGFDQTAWTEASNLMNANLGQNIIYNGLGTLEGNFKNPPVAIKLNPTTFGGMLEGCYANMGGQNPLPRLVVWQNYETTELTMSSIQKPFVCRGIATFPAKTSLAMRIYMYASFLLTYDPSSSIISEKFSTTSNLDVFPEETLAALSPIIPAPASLNDLQTDTWTFGRQYAACYLWGQPVGSCAVVVNADNTANPHPFPWPGQYSHTLVLNGEGIIDGGTANVAGPPPPATIQGTSAIIAIQ